MAEHTVVATIACFVNNCDSLSQNCIILEELQSQPLLVCVELLVLSHINQFPDSQVQR